MFMLLVYVACSKSRCLIPKCEYLDNLTIILLGTLLGASALVYLVQLKGVNYITEAFPNIFGSGEWTNTQVLLSLNLDR